MIIELDMEIRDPVCRMVGAPHDGSSVHQRSGTDQNTVDVKAVRRRQKEVPLGNIRS